jgi:hypothetical protein
MARFLPGQSWTLTVDQQQIEVTSGLSTPNERWTHTDAQGHEHRYDHGYPTLDLVVDAEHWCDGSEGWAPHDEHMAVDESHYECKLCREVIEPALDPPFTPKYVPGSVAARLRGVLLDGRMIEVLVDEDEVARIQAEGEPAAREILEGAPPDRIVSTTFSDMAPGWRL